MEKNDARDAASGSNKEMLKDIAAQYAIIASAQELIKALARQPLPKTDNDSLSGGWVYSMADLEKWIKLFTNKQEEL